MIKAGIVGGTGYTGVELLRLLSAHPQVEIAQVTSRSDAGSRVSEVYPNLRGAVDIEFVPPAADLLGTCDVVFFATPNGTAMKMAAELLETDTRVIDLAADFRLRDAQVWTQWYGEPHACPDLLAEAVYGLPEVNRSMIRDARLVACPGCYPTAVQLGIVPLLEAGVCETSGIVADVKSGISGAGRNARISSLMAESGESLKAYGIAGHRHHPEICQGLESVAGGPVSLVFAPHLIPMIRGIHATLYVNLKADCIEPVQELFERRYSAEAFVDVLPPGSHPDTRDVRGSNRCQIAVHVLEANNSVVILSVIDNLVKGAAGQAVQNMNLMFGLDEGAGLGAVGLYP